MDSQEKNKEKSVMDFKEMLKQLVSWMHQGKYCPRGDVEYCDSSDQGENVLGEHSTLRKSFYLNAPSGEVALKIFTHTNVYSITARLRVDGTAYLGATMVCRRSRTGEWWQRGNDLADGEFCRETWGKILADIVSAETLDIMKPVQELVERNRDLVKDTDKAVKISSPGKAAVIVC